MSEVKLIAVNQIRPNPHNPRKTFKGEVELGLDMKRHGQKTPCRVYPDGEWYTLIAGERRLKGALAVGIEHLKCLVEKPLNPTELRVDQLIDNTHESLTALDFAETCQLLMKENGWNAVALAGVLGCSESKISKALSIASSLAPSIQEMVREAKIGASLAYDLARCPLETQLDIAQKVASGEVSEAVAKSMIRERKQTKKPSAVKLTLQLTTFEDVKAKLGELAAQVAKIERLGASIHTLKGILK